MLNKTFNTILKYFLTPEEYKNFILLNKLLKFEEFSLYNLEKDVYIDGEKITHSNIINSCKHVLYKPDEWDLYKKSVEWLKLKIKNDNISKEEMKEHLARMKEKVLDPLDQKWIKICKETYKRINDVR